MTVVPSLDSENTLKYFRDAKIQAFMFPYHLNDSGAKAISQEVEVEPFMIDMRPENQKRAVHEGRHTDTFCHSNDNYLDRPEINSHRWSSYWFKPSIHHIPGIDQILFIVGSRQEDELDFVFFSSKGRPYTELQRITLDTDDAPLLSGMIPHDMRTDHTTPDDSLFVALYTTNMDL